MWHGKRSKIVMAEPSTEVRNYTWFAPESLEMPFPLTSFVWAPSVSVPTQAFPYHTSDT